MFDMVMVVDDGALTIILMSAAGIVVWIVAAIFARIIVWYRSRPFKNDSDKAAEAARIPNLIARYDLKELVDRAETPEYFSEDERYVEAENEKAKLLQIRYHDRVARSLVSLAFALVVLCLTITILKDQKLFKTFAAAVELVAVIYAFALFIHARHINRRWILQRTLSELLRHWAHLALIFRLRREDDEGTANRAMAGAAARIERDVVGKGMMRTWQRVLAPDSGDSGETKARESVHRKIESYWEMLRKECSELGLKRVAKEEDMALYIRERPLFQLSFFIGAHERLHHVQKKRERYMSLLFVALVALTFLEAAIVFKSELPSRLAAFVDPAPSIILDWITLALLMVLIISTALTSLYVSRNDRSLMHRYFAQARRIRSWLSDFKALYRPGVALPEQEQAVIGRVLAFEDVMIDELLDWIHITSRDVIELGG